MRFVRALLPILAMPMLALPGLAPAQSVFPPVGPPPASQPAAQSAAQSPFPDPATPAAAPRAPQQKKAKAAPAQNSVVDERFANDDQFEPGGAPNAAPVAKKKAARPAMPGAGRTTVACAGAFAKGSAHMRLAQDFDSRNLEFTEVDGPDGSRQMASVLFGKDPKRRLEVWWQDDANRMETSLIVINGQSQWTAPKGMRLGMAIAAIEKLNGKPFKLSGIDKDNHATVTDWQGGALSSFPGGCKASLRFVADRGGDTAGLAGGTEVLSNDAAVKTAKLKVAEILIGY